MYQIKNCHFKRESSFQKGTKCFLFICVIKFMKHLLSLAWKLVLKQGDIAPIINMADKQHVTNRLYHSYYGKICLLRKAEGQKKKPNQSQLSEQGSPMPEHQDTTSIQWKTLSDTELSRENFLLLVPQSPSVNKRLLNVYVEEQKMD